MANGTTINLYANGTIEKIWGYGILNAWQDSDCSYTEVEAFIWATCMNKSQIYLLKYDSNSNNETYITKEEYMETGYIVTWSNGTIFDYPISHWGS